MARHLTFGLFALALVGCASSDPHTANHVQSPTPSMPTTITKGVPPVPPTRIGDGSAIAFTEFEGLRSGTGTATISGKTEPLQSVRFALKADGTATLDIAFQKSQSIVLQGQWKQASPRAIELSGMKGLPGLPKDATGEIQFMDRANPSLLKIQKGEIGLDFRMGG